MADLFNREPHARAELLLAAPKILQAICAALADFYTWELASYIHGESSTAASATLVLTVTSPWQWFCSTRTFSNSLETTLTIVALYNWPWHWQLPLDKPDTPSRVRTRQDAAAGMDEVTRLRRALLCAAVATVLRPTNVLVWAILTLLTFLRGWKIIGPSCLERSLFARETVLCGGLVLLLSIMIDRIFYEAWVFPPLNFLHVNVVQSLATFYGNNDWHYYISQGYPLLLTTALPFTLIGLYHSLNSKADVALSEVRPLGRAALRSLSIICLVVPAFFSNIAHKEVRFIYPLLPALHIVTGLPWSTFFSSTRPASSRLATNALLVLLVALNISISYYTTQIHNSGIIFLTHYLRNEFETAYLPASGTGTVSKTAAGAGLEPASNMTIGMLMPCHSTPWRSHLQYPPSSATPGINAWALTCDPPLDLNATARATYLDEADQFYADPGVWLKKNMSRDPPRSKVQKTQQLLESNQASSSRALFSTDGDRRSREEDFWTTRRGRRPWPDYLVFFAQLEPTLTVTLRDSGYVECQRLFNSHWHDDWRRVGDVVVWCLDPTRREGGEVLGGNLLLREHIESQEQTIEVQGLGEKAVEEIEKEKKAIPKKRPVTRVVEKPFWKVREEPHGYE